MTVVATSIGAGKAAETLSRKLLWRSFGSAPSLPLMPVALEPSLQRCLADLAHS